MPKITADLYYDHHVFVCLNERPAGHERGCCASKGAEKLQKYMKARAKELGIPKARINKAGCLDRCEEGPVMVVYPEGVWYRPTTPEEVDDILQQHLIAGQIVEHLQIYPQGNQKKKEA